MVCSTLTFLMFFMFYVRVRVLLLNFLGCIVWIRTKGMLRDLFLVCSMRWTESNINDIRVRLLSCTAMPSSEDISTTSPQIGQVRRLEVLIISLITKYIIVILSFCFLSSCERRTSSSNLLHKFLMSSRVSVTPLRRNQKEVVKRPLL